mgnify:CR=1 FL=1
MFWYIYYTYIIFIYQFITCFAFVPYFIVYFSLIPIYFLSIWFFFGWILLSWKKFWKNFFACFFFFLFDPLSLFLGETKMFKLSRLDILSNFKSLSFLSYRCWTKKMKFHSKIIMSVSLADKKGKRNQDKNSHKIRFKVVRPFS